jgi:hypothetical protein
MSLRISILVVLGATVLPGVARAQVYSIPTPRPAVSAADRGWFVERRPLFFAGDLYYPGGSRYHFNPDVMVETGTYDGVPLFADTTATPYDEVLVPVGGGLVQPYQRLRAGYLAGTSGSHVSDFPIEVVPWEPGRRPQSARAGVPPQPAPTDIGPESVPSREGDEEARRRLLQPPGRIETILVPQDNRGIWIVYEGQRWNAAGQAVAREATRFSKIGEYFGFPVFSTSGREEIFIPGADAMLAAYRKDGR